MRISSPGPDPREIKKTNRLTIILIDSYNYIGYSNNSCFNLAKSKVNQSQTKSRGIN